MFLPIELLLAIWRVRLAQPYAVFDSIFLDILYIQTNACDKIH